MQHRQPGEYQCRIRIQVLTAGGSAPWGAGSANGLCSVSSMVVIATKGTASADVHTCVALHICPPAVHVRGGTQLSRGFGSCVGPTRFSVGRAVCFSQAVSCNKSFLPVGCWGPWAVPGGPSPATWAREPETLLKQLSQAAPHVCWFSPPHGAHPEVPLVTPVLG